MTRSRHDTYSLAGAERQLLVSYPADLSPAEAADVAEQLQRIGAKIVRELLSLPAPASPDRDIADAMAKWVAQEPAADTPRLQVTAAEPEPLLAAARRSVLDAQTQPSVPAEKVFADLAAPEAELHFDQPYPSVPATAEATGATLTVRGMSHRLAVLRALANGPLTQAQLVTQAGVPEGSISVVVRKGGSYGAGLWHRVKPSDPYSPYALTDAGRAALKEAGFVVGETKANVPETSPPETADFAGETETSGPIPETASKSSPPSYEVGGPRIDSSDPKAVAHEQCRLIAQAIAEGRVALWEISKGAGLPDDVTEKRLLKCGPQAVPGGIKYFIRGDNGLWRLTNAGYDLAREGSAAA